MFDNMKPTASGRRCFVPDATKPSIPDGTAVLHALCHAALRLRQEVHHV
jgi:hypothetical protein